MRYLSSIVLCLLMSLSALATTLESQVVRGLPVHMRDRWSTSTKSVHQIPFEVFVTDSKELIVHFTSAIEVTLEVKGADGKVVYTDIVSSTAADEEVTIDLSDVPSGNYKLFISGQNIDTEGDFCLN